MPVLEPVTRSSTCASPPVPRSPLRTLHTLLVEVHEPALAVVAVLQRGVRRAVVQPPEVFAFVERGRVQRLATPELLDHAFDPAVARAGRLAADNRHGRPEAEVHVRRLRFECVEIPAGGRIALT